MEINIACPRRLAQQLELCVSTLAFEFWFELILVELIVSERRACGRVGMLLMGGMQVGSRAAKRWCSFCARAGCASALLALPNLRLRFQSFE